VTLLAIGESSTALGGKDAWPAQAGRMLDAMNLGVRFQVVNQGIPGTDSTGLLEKLPANLARWKPDIVMVMMGINDGKKAFLDLGDYENASPVVSFLRNFKIYRLFSFYRVTQDDDWTRERSTAARAAREAALRARIAATPTDEDLASLADLYAEAGRPDDAASARWDRVRDFPSPAAWTALARHLDDQGDTVRKEQVLREATAAFPTDHGLWRALVQTVSQRSDIKEVLALLDRQVLVLPDAASWLDLADGYAAAGRLPEAGQALRQAAAAGAGDVGNARLGAIEARQGHAAEAEAAFRASVQGDPTGSGWLAFGRFLRQQGRSEEAMEAFSQALALGSDAWPFSIPEDRAINPGPSAAWLEMATLALESGDRAKAIAYLGYVTPNPITARNFLALADQVRAASARLVVVQYPLRDPWPLHLTVLPEPGVVFVDNEPAFRKAVAKDGYDAVFIDAYAVDFGHCSPRGNAIIADNVSRAIASTWYGGKP